VFFLLLSSTCPAGWQECILSYDQYVSVGRDASLLVRENIKVKAAGERIKHGITREFPTSYRWKGYNFKVGFKVLKVLRDGKPEGWFVKRLPNGVRIYVGKKDVLLSPGVHTYILVYRTDRQLGFFKDHDELYWNVNGTGGSFPINRLEAVVSLPEGVPRDSIRYEAYTGRYGERGRDYEAWIDGKGRVHFRTTRVLMPGENLTVVVGWPKGYVREPGTVQRVLWFLGDNLHVLVLFLTLVVVFLYYLWAWARVGKDPPKGTIMPEFHPPDGMSPAAVRYAMRMGYDDTCFAANLIDMAVKGTLKIREGKGGRYELEKLAKDRAALTGDEEVLYSSLPDRLHLRRGSYSAPLRRAVERLKMALARTYGHLFRLNSDYVTLGVLLSIAGVVVSLFLGGGGTVARGAVLAVFVGMLFSVLSISSRVAKVVVLFLVLLFFFPFFALFFGSGNLLWDALVILPILLLIAVNLFFGKYMAAPTREGRRVMDRIEGFRMFLRTAEKERLKTLFPEDSLPRIFERFLPYALALDVVDTWANKFAEDLKAMDYRPEWYEGPYYMRFTTSHGYATFFNDVGRGISSTVASSIKPPGSSSGFSGSGGGGGGFSGGGGGGGGVGGW